MMFTPQACRRITGAIEALPDANSRDRWRAWAQQGSPNALRSHVPYEIAVIALQALESAERRIEQQLG